MASFQAIAAVAEAVVAQLKQAYSAALFDGNALDFKVFGSAQFKDGLTTPGVSLFVYRIVPNGAHRTPGGGLARDGRRMRTSLPVEVHFLLTAWAADPSLQTAVAGYMMRVLEDHPTLPASELNRVYPQAFRPEESVEIVLGEMRNEDLFQLWDRLTERGYQLSVPYLARVLLIDSLEDSAVEAPVKVRDVGLEQGVD
ncbi:MAG TPA: DUF4255 domain-containing protein [Symbiobacteriaceae bacterium]|nr:DUF4255 domain-containing protein [Symbiobacteriaceae bacterium]